jgi:cytochrome c biogenesis protein CcmG/thiol:disulfide interchange protein DsbE
VKKTNLLAVVCFLVLVLVSCACRKETSVTSSAPGAVGKGTRAPDFTLRDLDDEEFSLKSLEGKVVLLDFWATWCYPCRVEIPHFIQLQKDYNSKGFEVVGIALDRNGARVVKPFAEKEGINYTVLIGDADVAAAYGGIKSIPTTFVIDKKGTIYSKYVGVPKDMRVFENDVRRLLGD